MESKFRIAKRGDERPLGRVFANDPPSERFAVQIVGERVLGANPSPLMKNGAE